MDAAWISVIIAGAVALTAAAAWAAKHTWHITRRIIHFLDDFFGQEARDGLPARPGIVARLSGMEEFAARVAAEMSPNHGQSLRDVVHRTAADVADIKADQAQLRASVEAIQARNGR